MRHHGAFLGESRHMLGLTAEKGLGNEKGEIRVLRPRFLEHPVKDALHLLPNRIPIRLYDHATPHGGLLRKICLYNQVIVPLGIILGPFRYFLSHLNVILFIYKLIIIIVCEKKGTIIAIYPQKASHNVIA